MGVSAQVAKDVRELSSYTREPLYESMPSASPTPEGVIATHQRDKTIHERVKALPAKERKVIVRRYGLDGGSDEIVPVRQIAAEQRISFGEVRLREIRGLGNLAEALKEI